MTPFLVRLFSRKAIRLAAILAFAVYPLALFCYSNALSAETAEGKSRVQFFEDGHSLLPASEYLRGELPYRDILPAHGMIEDGLFDFAAMKVSGVSIASGKRARHVGAGLAAVALYFLALGVTGSPGAAFLAVLLSFLGEMFVSNIRLLSSLTALAFIAFAIRMRRPRLYLWAGIATVFCGMTSIDFGAYTLLTLIVALWRTHEQRRIAIRFAAIGIAIAAVPLAIALFAFGIFGDFLRGTFVETLGVGPAYTLTFFLAPVAIAKARAFPEVLAALLDRQAFGYLLWAAMAMFLGVTIARRVSRRLEPLVILSVWMVALGFSYAERHHLYFEAAGAIVVVFVIRELLRRRNALAFAAIAVAIILAGPTTHIGVVGYMRLARGPLEPAWVEVHDVPRARGVLFHENDAQVIASVKKYVDLTLKPDETFFDFTNSGILYFLFRRDCPIREYEVAFYETEAGQREVIRRLEANPNVRAALVPNGPKGRFSVDGIPNADRAPLVWHYLQTHFHPDFEEGEVVFWRRNGE